MLTADTTIEALLFGRAKVTWPFNSEQATQQCFLAEVFKLKA